LAYEDRQFAARLAVWRDEPLVRNTVGRVKKTRLERAMELELKERSTMSREDAAARLHAIADELASGNDIILERGQARFVAKVPDEVALKIEFEVEDNQTEFEIELTW
jgi:amphi-Trp domain-containing protein